MKKAALLLLLVALLASACATPVEKPTPTPDTRPTVTPQGATPSAGAATAPTTTSPLATPTGEMRTLTVLTHDSYALSDEVLQQFEQANNAKVQFIKQGDAGQALTRAILTKDNPEADVIFGVDNTFMSRALAAGILEAYQPIGWENMPPEFKLDPTQQLIPIDYGDVCLNYDKAYFEEKKLMPPQTLADLTKPEYKDLLVIENPAGSSPGLAFMLATVSAFGEDRWLGFWADLKKNGVKVVEDWNTAYYTEFSGSSGKGPRPIVVSYASSPPAEVIFADPPIDQAPTVAITTPQTCFRQIEFAGILKGSKQRDLAQKWIDFMLSVPYQEDLPLNQFVYPINPQAKLPEAFVKWSSVAQETANLAPEVISKNRE
ncbi:MAG: thiamine ABC transporter substrate-binding protein, partial [Chloroflexi bacterium]|nr:thiamine ABC transporter substrate-binding protein [Chloroflexota bacterium]